MSRIYYTNDPGSGSAQEHLYERVSAITTVDTNRLFRFVISFKATETAQRNFKMVVILNETNEEIATLSSGDEAAMKELVKQHENND